MSKYVKLSISIICITVSVISLILAMILSALERVDQSFIFGLISSEAAVPAIIFGALSKKNK